MSDFLQRLELAASRRCLLARGQKILVAVSGGADSMALLHALHLVAPSHRWRLAVAHFNHRLRGRASNADEALVRRTAAALGLPFFAGAADVKTIAARSKISLEMAARKLRHEFLARTAAQHHFPVIALAHHGDDQVELFFLRLLRGTGGEGIAGMKLRSPSPADPAVTLVRPLLDFNKTELLGFVREHKIAFRNDATNASHDFLRNRIRHELLPLLRKNYQPGLDKTVLRLMEIVGAEADFVSAAAEKFSAGRARGFASQPPAIQRKVLQRQLAAIGFLPDFERIEQLRLAPGKKVSACAGLTVARDAAGKVHCHETSAPAFNSAGLTLDLSGRQGRAEFAGRKLRWRLEPAQPFRRPPAGPAAHRAPLQELFDADQVGGRIILRHWQPGDRFQPIGLKSPAKLQDLFVNAKIPAARRRQLVLAATAAGTIFWVEGLRISDPFKLTPRTRRQLVWQAS